MSFSPYEIRQFPDPEKVDHLIAKLEKTGIFTEVNPADLFTPSQIEAAWVVSSGFSHDRLNSLLNLSRYVKDPIHQFPDISFLIIDGDLSSLINPAAIPLINALTNVN